MKKIGEIYYLDENKDKNPEIIISSNKENCLKNYTDKNPEIVISSNNEDCLKNLIELYYVFDNFNSLIKDESKILKSQENYYLINKEWTNYLNKCYNYDQISQTINNCEKNKDLINKYREQKNIENGFDSNDINHILGQIPKELKNEIKNKDKTYDINLYKSFEKRIKEGNKEVFYYDECILIDEKIKNILVNINGINDKFDKQINCFISAHNIYLCYKLKDNQLISIGKTDENNILKINILVTLDNNLDYIAYMEDIIMNLS